VGTTNRFRKTDARFPSHYVMRDYDAGTGVNSSTTEVLDTGVMASGSYKHIYDVQTPGWEYRDVIKRGGVYNHPMQLYREDRGCVPSAWSFGPHPTWGTRTLSGTLACDASVPPHGADWTAHLDNIANAVDLALVEAYAKMNSPDVLFRVCYAERAKTAALVGEAAAKADKIFRKMQIDRDLARLRGKSVAQALSTAWLTARFGVRPTLADVDGAAKAAAHVKPSAGKLLIERGGTEREFKGSYSSTTSFPGGIQASRVGSWHEKAKVSAGVFFSIKDISDPEWKAHCFGIASDAIPASYWEELPYTWLVDYFVKVGDWLQASTPNPFFVVRGDWVTTVRRQVNEHHLPQATLYVNLPPYPTYVSGGGQYREEIDIVTRETDQGVPSLPPMSGKPLSFAQTLDIASLAVQNCLKSLKRLRI